MVALVLMVAGIYLFIVGKRQSGALFDRLDDVTGEDVATFSFVALGIIFLILGACLGMLHIITP